MGQNRMTTKEKVAKLKADLKKKMALLRGEQVDEKAEEPDTKEEVKDGEAEITIDTSK